MTRTHRAASLVAAFAFVLAGLAGCASMSRTQKGAVIGAGAGGVVGAVVGGKLGSTTKGAIIGAAVGGAAGAIIGHEMDEQAEELAAELENAEVERVGEGIAVKFPSGLMFDYDSARLRAGAQRDLADFASSLRRHEGTEVLIVGHTDARGTDAYNQDLSERRARAASDYLVSQGVERSRIRTVGRGESEPIADNESESGMQENRRVEVAIVAGEEMIAQARAEAR